MSLTVAEGNIVYHSAGNCIIETASKTLIAGCKASVIPSDGSVTSIAEDAFSYCRSLTSITIPSSITSIGKYAFNHCDNLTSVVFEEPDGWSAGSTAILSEDLADPATAAEYLVNMYWECIWTRE